MDLKNVNSLKKYEKAVDAFTAYLKFLKPDFLKYGQKTLDNKKVI